MDEYKAKRLLMMSSIFFVAVFIFVVLDNYRYSHVPETSNDRANVFIEQLIHSNVAIEYVRNKNNVYEFINRDKEITIISTSESGSVVTTIIPNNGSAYIFGEDNIITNISGTDVNPIMIELSADNPIFTGYYKGLKGERLITQFNSVSYDVRIHKKSLLGKEESLIIRTDNVSNKVENIGIMGYAYDWSLDKTFWYGEIEDGESALGHIPYVIPKK